MLVDLIVVVVEVVVFVDREDIRFVALANMPRGYHAGAIFQPLICGAFRASGLKKQARTGQSRLRLLQFSDIERQDLEPFGLDPGSRLRKRSREDHRISER